MHGFRSWAPAVCLCLVVVAMKPARAEVRFDGQADAAAVVESGQVRFTVLTPTLLRLEYAADGQFEDRPSLFAVQRRLPVPEYQHRRRDGWLEIATQRLSLRYKLDTGPFTAGNLSIAVSGPDDDISWQPGLPNEGNLGGTVRTLDGCRGPLDLGEGVLSRDGWYLLDDSANVVLDGWMMPWPKPRPEGERTDWYFFGYANDYATAFADLVGVGGAIPLPPRFAFGSWYSRYWPYTTEDFLAIADGYRERGYPLDVMVIDMDWHLDGWTGYTWNRKLIPDPEELLKQLHERGLHTTLNLHPHAGVGPHEEAYPAFAQAMGIDPETKQAIPFDIADPKYVEFYFRLLHHPIERQGVDFWWVDWQQERTTKIPGLDPLPWLNHLHFHDRGRNETGRRGLGFSRWGGWGNHRYPIQFSGDTESTWRVLKFLVPFTSTAGNVGAAYWSHDLGGHWSSTGRIDPELYARWLQFGAFTAAMRVHSTRDPDNDRRPWIYGEDFERSAHAAYDLRYRLLPYTYTMARKTYDTGMPLTRPMYVHHPDDPRAYQHPGQYYYGDDIIVAPAVDPGRGQGKIADVEVWLPKGEWYDPITNVSYAGPANLLVKPTLDRIPVFVRGGRPIPMQASGRLNANNPIDLLVVRVYPGVPGETVLYEDDGESSAFREPGGSARTRLTYTPDEQTGAFEVVIHPVEGAYRGMPSQRTVLIEAGSVLQPATVTVDGQEVQPAGSGAPGPRWIYDVGSLTFTVRLPERDLSAYTEVRVTPVEAPPDRLAGVRASHETIARAVDCWRQLGVEKDGGIPQMPRLEAFLKSHDAEQRWSKVDEWNAAIARDHLEYANNLPGGASALGIEAMLGAALRLDVAPADDTHVAVSGDMWLTQLPPSGSVTGKVTLKLPAPGSSKALGPQAITFEKPGRQRLAFRLPIEADRLHALRGRVIVELNWADHPLRLTRKFEWNSSYVNKWWLAGPFAGGKGPRAEELAPESDASLDATYTGLGGKPVTWQQVEVGRHDHDGASVVSLYRIFGGKDRTAFAQTVLHSAEEATVDFVMRHDDGVIVWVNGTEVHAYEKPRGLFEGAFTFPVKLKKGPNQVLIKIDQLGGDWGFDLRIQAPEGKSLSVVRVAEPG